MRVSICKSADCQMPLYWRENVDTDKRVPLDTTPVSSDERFVVKRAFHYRILDHETCRQATMADWEDHDLPLYCSHFKTCTDPARWGRSNPNGTARSRPNTSAEQ